MKYRALTGLFALLAASAAIQAVAQQSPMLASTKIDQDVNAALQRFAAPGAAIMVVSNGRVVRTGAFGLRDVQHNLPVRTDTPFEIGSITKQFTAASILQLQEAGKLQIDKLLSSYLPDAPHASEVTLRQLLTHTSGLHDYLDGPDEEVDRLASRPISYQDLISRVASLPLDFPPGSRWSYSNTGYLLLGKVIEAVSGEPYQAYLQHHILNPLHMKNTFTTAEESRLPMAIGYRHVNGKLEIAPIIDASWGQAAGFLVSTLHDLALWDAALRGGKIVSAASYRQMTAPFMTSENGSADYGLGLFVDSAYGQPRVGHTGGTQGSTTADEYFPALGVRIIAFTNSGDRTPEAGEALTNIIFADLYPDIASNAQKPAPDENTSVTQTVHAAFRELQTGKVYTSFSVRLKDKLANGVGAKFIANLGPYGEATAEVFKGARQEGANRWYDYMVQFGPGVFLPFKVKIGQDGVVDGFSVG
jgi:D-alanyl-D-alanine carboxypeptidase